MSWDEYFKNMCDTVATNSKCLSRKIGAILVRDNSILCTGYNGPPRGVPHCGLYRAKVDQTIRDRLIACDCKVYEIRTTCPRLLLGYRSGEALDLCPAGHAERNVLITAARHGVATKGATLYMSCSIPCSPCLVEIINAGIKEIVVTGVQHYDKLTQYILKHSDLKWRLYEETYGEQCDGRR
jgi:dCMP deaminase